MEKNTILHVTRFPWVFMEGNRLTLTLRMGRGTDAIVEVWYCDPCDFCPGGGKIPALRCSGMDAAFLDSDYVYWRATISMDTHKLRYQFRILCDEEEYWFTESGLSEEAAEEDIRPFQIPYIYLHEQCQRPEWVINMNWYQIFPDRFSREKDDMAEAFVPTRENFYGGTLKGIKKKIPYLKELGINGIYLNPIFSSVSNHRYDTADYMAVEPKLGSREDLKELVTECHKNGMKVMLDGVYNHCGYDSFIWQDVVKNGEKSKYYDWFFIYDSKALMEEDCRNLSSERMKKYPPYEAFAFAANMPKWNTANKETADYLIRCAEYWTTYLKLDAWRLDVPDEVDKTFLKEFYRRIKAINPEIYIIGEIWQDAHRWFEDSIFDGVMDYPFYFSVRDFFLRGTMNAYEFCDRITRHTLLLPEKVQMSNFHFLSNHDLPRALTVARENKEALKNAYMFLALFGGSMSVYYGDEAGLPGENDPDCRRAFPWNSIDNKLLEAFRKILSGRTIGYVRKTIEPLSQDQIMLRLTGDNCQAELVFERGGKLISKCCNE